MATLFMIPRTCVSPGRRLALWTAIIIIIIAPPRGGYRLRMAPALIWLSGALRRVHAHAPVRPVLPSRRLQGGGRSGLMAKVRGFLPA